MNFVVQLNVPGDIAGKPLPLSLSVLEAETLPLALRAVQKTLDATQIDSAVVYVPVRLLNAARRVEVTDANGNAVPIDSPLGDVENRTRPILVAEAGSTGK